MEEKVLKKCLLFFALIFCSFFFGERKLLFAEDYLCWNFEDCEIKDILYSVSLDCGISIVCDDSVSGKGTLRFAGNDFENAFNAFLKENRLYVRKEKNIWTISKARVDYENEILSLDAYDLTAEQILEKFSLETSWSVTYDVLPSQKMSVHFKGSVSDVMENLGRRFGNYDVIVEGRNCHFLKKNESRRADGNYGVLSLEKNDAGIYSVDVKDARLSEVIEMLFEKFSDDFGGCGFCLPVNSDAKILRTTFAEKNAEEVLGKICGQNGFSYVLKDGVYYIFEASDSKDEILSGKREWKKIDLNYSDVQDFIPLVLKRVGRIENIILPGNTSFLCKCSEEENALIEELILEVDVKMSTYVVNLKYKKPAEFMEHLPPFIDRTSLFFADDSKSLYFKGTEEAYKGLCEQIEIFDVPEKRISYDLLILQYDQTEQNDWSSSLSAKRLSLGDRNSLSAMLGSVMGFNLNVVSAFGLTFAAELQSSIENNHTKVFADTTLHGVSGKQINFQNTNTYRYRDNNLDPNTGKPVYSGVTKEIISGIKIDVLGWVSGDGMITSQVTASVSRRGTDTSSSTGNPPPTSEKIITTEVCGKSGEPVVLSGLILNSESDSEKGVPIISKIPLLGRLFKSKAKSKEYSQMVIYLVPHIENETEFYSNAVEAEHSYEWANERINNFKRMTGWENE